MNESTMDQCAAQAREGDFLHDLEAFLDYVEKEKIQLTPKLNLIPLRNCRRINSLFRRPDPLEKQFTDEAYLVRSEIELPRLNFMDHLSLAAGLTRITAQGGYRKGPHLSNCRDTDPCRKIGVLFLCWWNNYTWGLPCSSEDIFVKALFENRSKLVPLLRRTGGRGNKALYQFADEVLRAVGWRDDAVSKELSNQYAKFGVEMTILQPMSYFGAVNLVEEKNEYGFDGTVAFSLTEPLGRWLVSILPVPPSPLFAS